MSFQPYIGKIFETKSKFVLFYFTILSNIIYWNIWTIFRCPSKAESQKFGDLITLDFNYFKQGNSDFEDKYERRVESNDELAAADEELKDTFSSLLKRFYRLFESIYNYVRDLNSFLKDVEDGSFIQMNSLEAIFIDEDGKQLLVSSAYTE